MQHKQTIGLRLFLLSFFLFAFFQFLFLYDNKYTTPPPYGQDGMLRFDEKIFSRSKPLYLIDGWKFTNASGESRFTYIGEYSNLQQGNPSASSHGNATYELNLIYTGTPQFVNLDFPELFSNYAIYLNTTLLAKGNGSAHVAFVLNQGSNLITVHTTSYSGYYSGMYYPPALTSDTLATHITAIQTCIYGFAFFTALVLALFTLCVWGNHKNQLLFWFGLLCSFFALYMSYYFVHLLSVPFRSLWYYVEDFALYGLIFCLVRITKLIANLDDMLYMKIFMPLAGGISFILLLLHALIPYGSWFLFLHGKLKNGYFIAIFIWLLLVSIQCFWQKKADYFYILSSNLIFGTGLLLNFLSANKFEPIFSLWQFEWCGLWLVLLFGFLMIRRNRQILKENEQLTSHLETLVEQRTSELTLLLQERHAFFADMAHDLKAPLVATQSFVEAIRSHRIGIDDELDHYLTQVECKQREMSKRVQSLNVINQLDKIESSPKKLSVIDTLKEIHATHHAEAEVSAVYFDVLYPTKDCFIYMQQEKLFLLFENLFYNALRATPPNGKITISTNLENTFIQFLFSDTGCGVSQEELPLIFKRFYVGQKNQATGSGLGLYIVKTIVDEAGGKIGVSSQLGQGTCFIIEFPLY